MSDIQHLPDGIYEEVVSQSLEEKIKKAPDLDLQL